MALSADYIHDAEQLPCNGCSSRQDCSQRQAVCVAYNNYLDGKPWAVRHRIPEKNINMELFDVHSIALY